MKIKLITIGLVSLIVLSGCFNGSSNSGDNGVSSEKAGVQAYSSKGGNDEAVAIDDAAMLRSDISALFGNADAEPVAVEDGDTVQDVLDRL